ncbi:MAG TPA: hypothetical protein GX739_05870 [Firmicutes bacterium]|nr:hypothetical protein [Bacillota bacterium]
MLISPNQRVELIVGEGAEQRVFLTRIEDLDELDDYLLLAAPIVNGEIVPLRRETAVTVSFYTYDMPHQGRYQAIGVVERRFKENSVPVILIKLTSEWQKIQLRDFVRVSVLIEGIYNGTNPCVIKDISGGGLLCSIQEELELGSRIDIDIPIEKSLLRLQCKVLRATRTERGYEYGCIFEDIDEPTRLQIIQYVYKRQIELYRKEINQ